MSETEIIEINKGFQFNHIQIGLTYPQANGLTKEFIGGYLMDWYFMAGDTKITIENFLVAKENHHEDDGIHFHVYIKLTNRLRSRNTRLFDIFEPTIGLLYHPHISKVYGIKNMIQYCTKEDLDPVANFDYSQYISKTPNWRMVFARKFKGPQDFLNFIVAKWPGYAANHYINIKSLAYDQYKQKTVYEPTYLLFNNVPVRMLSWVDCYLKLKTVDRPLSLILIGPSRTGKTEWARSLGRHMYFCNYFNLELWDDQAEYAVFDDMDIDPDVPLEKYFRSWKCFFGAQKEFTVTDKYCRKRNVKWGKPIIWISNNELNCNSNTLNYIRANSVRVNVLNDLY